LLQGSIASGYKLNAQSLLLVTKQHSRKTNRVRKNVLNIDMFFVGDRVTSSDGWRLHLNVTRLDLDPGWKWSVNY
jgi:hypothetical protein